MKALIIALLVALVLGITTIVFVNPLGVASWNTWIFHIKKADDVTNYMTRKQVEDTCRAMMASYRSDKIRYEQYLNATDQEQKTWAEQAKIRANTTAAIYNEFILKNSFVFQGNIPGDIKQELEYIT